jgi:hypothetical protein
MNKKGGYGLGIISSIFPKGFLIIWKMIDILMKALDIHAYVLLKEKRRKKTTTTTLEGDEEI